MPPVLSTPVAASVPPCGSSLRGASPFDKTQADSAFGGELSDVSDSDAGLAFDRVRTAVKDNQPLVSFIDFSRVFTGQVNPAQLVPRIETQLGIEFLRIRLPGANKETSMVKVSQLIELIKILPGKQADKLRNDPETYQILKDWLQDVFTGYHIEDLLGPIPELVSDITAADVVQLGDLDVDVCFKGKSIRLTRESPSRIAAYDILATVGGYIDAHQKWASLKEQYGDFGAQMWAFPGKERNPTPVITVPKMIELINLLQSPTALKFRQHGAKTLVRYLGGDVTLIKEIRAINEAQQKMPESHPMRIFGEEVEATTSVKRQRGDTDDDDEEFAVFKERSERRMIELDIREKELIMEERVRREGLLSVILTKREEILSEKMIEREDILIEKAKLELQEVQRVANLVTDGPSSKGRVLISDVFNDITEEWPTDAFKMKFGKHLAKVHRETKGQSPERSRDYYGKVSTSYAYYDYDFVLKHMLDFMKDPLNESICVPIKDAVQTKK